MSIRSVVAFSIGLALVAAGDAGEAGAAPVSVVDHGCRLVPDRAGWIDARSNRARVQGAVFTYVGPRSTITPRTDDKHRFASRGDGRLCIRGTSRDYAAIGFDLCRTGQVPEQGQGKAKAKDKGSKRDEKKDDKKGPTASQAGPDARAPLGRCPLGTKLAGLRLRVTGPTVPRELRVVFHEEGRDQSGYVLAARGDNVALVDEARVLYDPRAAAVAPAKIDGVHVVVAGDEARPAPFDLCLEALEPVTRGGACDTLGAATAATASTAKTAADGEGRYGTLPRNVSLAEARDAFAAWKRSYLRQCPGRGAWVPNPQDGGDGYSEGIGYGMLLAVAHGDRATFDGLWRFYRSFLDDKGLMHWKIGCDGVRARGSATDGDIDVATALVQAGCRWGGAYAAEARGLVERIRAHEIAIVGAGASGRPVLRPGDSFTDPSCVNPSYFAPGALRAFGRLDGDEAFWGGVVDEGYRVLGVLEHPATGLVPDWGHTDGGAPRGECDRPHAPLYGYDAARTPWRLALDYRWWGTEAARARLVRLVAFARARGPDALVDRYALDGTPAGGFHSPVVVGGFAAATVAADQATADRLYQALKAVTVDEYYPATLKALVLAFGAGLLDRCVL